jgi:hypothetical protein
MPHIPGAKFPYEGQPPGGLSRARSAAMRRSNLLGPGHLTGTEGANSGFALAYFGAREQVP